MVTSHASQAAQSHRQRVESTERGWSRLLNMWFVCANTACRRARCCRGSPSFCYPHNFPQLPEGVKDWFFLIGEFQKERLPFEEAWARLEQCGLAAEWADWHDLAHGSGALPEDPPGKNRKTPARAAESPIV